MLRLVWMLCVWFGATAASAQGWCAQQRSLMDSVETLSPHYEGEPLTYMGGTDIYLIVGQVDKKYRFSGKIIAPHGSETDIEVQVNPGGPDVFRLMGRVPPRILAMLQPKDHFVGLAVEERAILRQDDPKTRPRLFRVSQTECTEGYVLSPSPDYVKSLMLCLTTSRCVS